jgi:hypothetical protein
LGKRPSPIQQELLAEGSKADRKTIRHDEQAKAKALAVKMPRDPVGRQQYVKEQVAAAMDGKLDKEVFREFVRITGTHDEVDLCSVRLMKQRRIVRGT